MLHGVLTQKQNELRWAGNWGPLGSNFVVFCSAFLKLPGQLDQTQIMFWPWPVFAVFKMSSKTVRDIVENVILKSFEGSQRYQWKRTT